jgi:CrcB protein
MAMNEMNVLRAVVLAGIGGGVGSALRCLTSVWIGRYCLTAFSPAVFAVNVAGSFLAGLLLGLLERHANASPDLRYLLLTGFCGGYTTFSAFSAETIVQIESGHSLAACLYIAASVLLGVGAAWVGLTVARL